MKSKSKKIMEIIICIIIFIITLSILLVIINKTNINQNEFDNTNNIEEVNIIDDITYDDIDDTVLVEQDYSSKNALLIKNIKHDYSLYNSFDIDEYYTERDYCYIKVNYSKIERSFNNLQEVVYQRYIEEKGTWIKEKRDIENSLYLNPGNGIILDETNYYIPVYALHPGKNILMVT